MPSSRLAFACCIVATILFLTLENLRLTDWLLQLQSRAGSEGCGRAPLPYQAVATASNAKSTPSKEAPAASGGSRPPTPSFDVSEKSCAQKLPKLSTSNRTLLSCEVLGKDPYPTMDPKHEPFPTDLECGLVVIAAGSARCGSTAQLAYAKDALKLLGVAPLATAYWNVHLHHDAVPEDQKSARGRAISSELRGKIANRTRPGLVVMKSHEYDPRLIRLCERALVLTTHRHPFEAERSKKETFHGKVSRAKYAENHWNVPEAAASQRCWADSGSVEGVAGVVDQAHEGFETDPVASFLEVFASVEAAVLEAGLPLRRPKAIAEALRGVVARLSDEKNRALPSSRRPRGPAETGAGYWTVGERAKIACLYWRWFERYGYAYA